MRKTIEEHRAESQRLYENHNSEYLVYSAEPPEYIDLNKPYKPKEDPFTKLFYPNLTCDGECEKIHLGPVKEGDYEAVFKPKKEPWEHPKFNSWDTLDKVCKEWFKQNDFETKAENTNTLTEELIELKGLLIIYVNVGQSPNVRRVMDNMQSHLKVLDRLPQNWGYMTLPIRNGETRIETVRF